MTVAGMTAAKTSVKRVLRLWIVQELTTPREFRKSRRFPTSTSIILCLPCSPENRPCRLRCDPPFSWLLIAPGREDLE